MYDIKSMYLHVQLAPETQKYFSFVIEMLYGTTWFFVFQVVAFGYTNVTALMNNLLRSIKIHVLGVDTS